MADAILSMHSMTNAYMFTCSGSSSCVSLPCSSVITMAALEDASAVTAVSGMEVCE